MTDKTYTQADLDKISADADARIEAMDAKVQQALDEAKKAKAEARKLKDIDPAELATLESENEKLRADLAAANKAAKDAAVVAEKATKALETESAFTHRLVAENGLIAALTENGVTDPAYLEFAKDHHLGKVKIVADGENRNALYGDKSLADAIKEWAGTEAGKKFVAAPNNSGGGAPGSKGGGSSGKVMSAADHASLSPKQRADFFASGGELAPA